MQVLQIGVGTRVTHVADHRFQTFELLQTPLDGVHLMCSCFVFACGQYNSTKNESSSYAARLILSADGNADNGNRWISFTRDL
jgi:hypothetical protein